jgi:hypothetical protein
VGGILVINMDGSAEHKDIKGTKHVKPSATPAEHLGAHNVLYKIANPEPTRAVFGQQAQVSRKSIPGQMPEQTLGLIEDEQDLDISNPAPQPQNITSEGNR